MDFTALDRQLPPFDETAAKAARARWDSIAKPVGGLGLLEDVIVSVAGLTGSPEISIDRRAVLVLCADNGVVDEGVAQSEQAITAQMAMNAAAGRASVCCMAKVARADVIVVDVGMKSQTEGLTVLKTASGTLNMTKGPAMSREQAETAIANGIELVRRCHADGYRLLATGEIGIGNTTTSSAMASVLCGIPLEAAVGRGAGLSDMGLERKRDAIRRAIELNKPRRGDVLDVLCKLGGFDIAGMVGMFIGGALYRIPIIIDGFISAVSALAATRLCPACAGAMIASHVSAEPAARLVLDALGKEAVINARMRLGEGTGAVAAIPILDMALAVYRDMITYDDLRRERHDEVI